MIILKILVGALFVTLLSVLVLVLCSWVGPMLGTYMVIGLTLLFISWGIGDFIIGSVAWERKSRKNQP